MEFLNHIKELWEVPDSPSVTMLDCEGERVRFELPVTKVIALCSLPLRCLCGGAVASWLVRLTPD